MVVVWLTIPLLSTVIPSAPSKPISRVDPWKSLIWNIRSRKLETFVFACWSLDGIGCFFVLKENDDLDGASADGKLRKSSLPSGISVILVIGATSFVLKDDVDLDGADGDSDGDGRSSLPSGISVILVIGATWFVFKDDVDLDGVDSDSDGK